MKLIMRLFLGLHVFLYRLTGGKVGGHISSMDILLLDSVGRRTGKKRTTPVAFIRDGQNFVVTASNGGAPNHPGWYYNLRSQPKTSIQVMNQNLRVEAELAYSEDRQRLWNELVRVNSQFAEYQTKTSREIGMFILRPLGG